MTRLRTILFGGSFDPPHRGHREVAQAVLREGLADTLWFVPCGAHPFGRPLNDAEHRIAMLQFLLSPKMDICTCETDKNEPSYSYDTLTSLSALHPDRTFSWLIGSDLLPSFNEWHDYEQLLERFPVFVYPRKGFPFAPLYQSMIPLRQLPEIEVSSTIVRAALNGGRSIEDMVDPRVGDYIRAHQLYTPPHATV